MKTAEAEKIILEVLSGRRTPAGLNGHHARLRTLKEWDLAKIARSHFRNADGTRLLPHIEQALFARALHGLRRSQRIRLRTRYPGIVYVGLTSAGLAAVESGLDDAAVSGAEPAASCPRCGLEKNGDRRTCSLCGEKHSRPASDISQSVAGLTSPDAFLASELAESRYHGVGICAAFMALCGVGLFLVAFILEGVSSLHDERFLVPAITMSLMLGTASGWSLMRFRAGLLPGMLLVALACAVASSIRVAVGGTHYDLWNEAVQFHIICGLPIALGFGAAIGLLARRVAHAHGGHT